MSEQLGMSYIGKVIKVEEIPGADKIHSVTVVCGEGGKWSGVAEKCIHEGDKVRVFLQDAKLPETEEFKFMERRRYIVKMCRFLKQPSEVLVLPLKEEMKDIEIGTDITIIENVTKYEKPIHPSLGGVMAGTFPTALLPKTDETNYQSCRKYLEIIAGKPFYITQKCDGSSGTSLKLDGVLRCCSRNFELKDNETALIWNLARKYKFNEVLDEGFAIQFEMIGPSIQKNPMGLKEAEIAVFNVWDLKERKYLDYIDFAKFCKDRKLPMVPLIMIGTGFPENIEDDTLRAWAKGVYPNGKEQEGIVIRPQTDTLDYRGNRVSFKVINLDYKG